MRQQVVKILGTSGSGKSTLVRRIMDNTDCAPIYVDNRRRPIGYECNLSGKKFFILGHYESNCGGCDTVSGYDYMFDIIRDKIGEGFNVLFEGLIISSEFNRTAKLEEIADVNVFSINIPLEECLESVVNRRESIHKEKLKKVALHNKNNKKKRKEPVLKEYNPKNTIAKYSYVEGTIKRLEAHGIPVFEGNRDECYREIEKILL